MLPDRRPTACGRRFLTFCKLGWRDRLFWTPTPEPEPWGSRHLAAARHTCIFWRGTGRRSKLYAKTWRRYPWSDEPRSLPDRSCRPSRDSRRTSYFWIRLTLWSASTAPLWTFWEKRRR